MTRIEIEEDDDWLWSSNAAPIACFSLDYANL